MSRPEPLSSTARRSADEAVTIPVGTHVVIKEVRGVKLIVEMIPETENRN